MNESKAFNMEKRGVTGIDSEDASIHYFIDNARKGIVIAGTKGKAGFTVRQAKLVVKELKGILEVFFEG